MKKAVSDGIEKKKREEESLRWDCCYLGRKDPNLSQSHDCVAGTVDQLSEKLEKIEGAIGTVDNERFAFCVHCGSPTLNTEQIDAILKSYCREDKDLLWLRADTCVICRNGFTKELVTTCAKRRIRR